MRRPRATRPDADRSAFAGFRFPPEVVTVAVPGISRMAGRIAMWRAAGRAGRQGRPRHVHRWVQRFTPLFAEAARLVRHAAGDRWFVDETASRSPLRLATAFSELAQAM